MKQIFIIYVLTIFFFISCSDNKSGDKKIDVSSRVTKNKTDTEKVEISNTDTLISNIRSDINDQLTSTKNLNIFHIWDLEENANRKVGFISLSDIYPLSEHPDSLAIPNLENVEEFNLQYIKLSSKYRMRFFAKTNISETDCVFIYDYSKDVLLSFPVRKLNVVAFLNIYMEPKDCPCNQYDYMIGFEIPKNYLKELGNNFNALVFIGNKNPFIQGQMKPIVWQKIKAKKFPYVQIRPEDTAQFQHYLHSSYLQISSNDSALSNKYKCVEGNVYCCEANGLQYYVKEFLSGEYIYMRQLVVIDLNTKEIILHEIFYSHESAEPSPLNFVEGNDIMQWTGMLFKNRSPVILGFEYVSFGCDRILFLSSKKEEIYINCDNRH